MVRYNYTIDVIENEAVIEQFTATTVKAVYERLKQIIPNEISMPFITFNIYYFNKKMKNPHFTITLEPYEKKSRANIDKNYRQKKKEELQKYKDEISRLQQQLQIN